MRRTDFAFLGDVKEAGLRQCPECRSVVGGRDRFCMYCGASLPDDDAATAPTVAPPAPGLESLDPERTLDPEEARVRRQDASPESLGDMPTLIPVDDSGDVPTAAMRAPVQLRIVAGRDVDKAYILPATGGEIGREDDTDVLLENDVYVSPTHARVWRDENGVFVEDMGSVNGTFFKVSGKQQLKPGDEFKVGQSIFRLEK